MKIKDCQLKEALTSEKSDSVFELSKKLKENLQGSAIILDKKAPIGIVSLTDINNRLVAEAKDAKATKVEEIMTSPIQTCDLEESLAETYIIMVKNNLHSCPVTEKGKLKGILELREIITKLPQIK